MVAIHPSPAHQIGHESCTLLDSDISGVEVRNFDINVLYINVSTQYLDYLLALVKRIKVCSNAVLK